MSRRAFLNRGALQKVAYSRSTHFNLGAEKKMAKNKQSIPSSMGGIVRYMDEEKSKFKIKPGVVVFVCVVIIVLLMILQFLAKSWFA
jgi:preprotein translocase subunit Sec61beta